MPIIQPNTADIGNIEPNTYPGEIAAVEYKTSKEKGTPMLAVTAKLDTGGTSPRTRITNVMLSGPGAYQFDSLLRACKLDKEADRIRDESKDGRNPSFDTDVLVGQRLNFVVDIKMYQGQERDEIKGFLPL